VKCTSGETNLVLNDEVLTAVLKARAAMSLVVALAFCHRAATSSALSSTLTATDVNVDSKLLPCATTELFNTFVDVESCANCTSRGRVK